MDYITILICFFELDNFFVTYRRRQMTDTIIIGGGQTGRGFIGRLLFESGIPFTILDKNSELIDALNRKGNYRVRFFSERAPMTVTDFEAYETDSPQALEAVKNAKNIFISVGTENLETASRYLLEHHANPKNVILCENAAEQSRVVRDVLKKGMDYTAIHFVETAVFCKSLDAGDGSFDIFSEGNHKLIYDVKNARGSFFRTPFLCRKIIFRC